MKRARPKLLAVFAHPDDETFLAGPLLAKYAAEGTEVGLVCATLPHSEPQKGQRQAELEAAASVLGIISLHFLGYSDSPMRAIEALPAGSLAAAPAEEVAEAVLGVLRTFLPQVVVTDAAYGAYGHPDHILVHRATLHAVQRFAAASDAAPLRLYAMAYPLGLVRLWVRAMRWTGVDVRRLAGRDDINLEQLVRGSYPLSARVDVRPYVGHRKAAGQQHQSQLASAPWPLKLLERAPIWAQQWAFGHTHLTRLHPAHQPGPPEGDLFQDLPEQ